jgi:hypothetical protein
MPPAEEVQETSMRDDLEAAIQPFEEEDTEGESATNEEEETAKAQATPETSEGEVSEQATKPDGDGHEQTTKPDGDEHESVVDRSDRRDATNEGVDGSELGAKAPASWTPAAREGWNDLPDAIKQQVSKREGEIARALEDGKENRKTGERFSQVTSQFASVLAAEGAQDPVTGVHELMKVVATLQSGSPQQKAEKIAGFISHYGVPIDALDNLLAGNTAAPVNDPMRQMLDDRLKPVDNLLQRMDQAERQRNYDANQKAISEVTTFKAANEFYTDVQNDMADMVEMAEKRGITMPLQEAYDKACALHPEISKVQAGRAEKTRLLGSANTIEQKRAAASSIAGPQGGPAGAAGDLSLHQQITDAWDSQVG